MDIADTGIDRGLTDEVADAATRRRDEAPHDVATTTILLPSRPQIRRDQVQPPPPQQPPPPPAPPPQDETDTTTDSLSLGQLRRLVTDLPRFEPTAYAFVYADTSNFVDELEEWFSFSPMEENQLLVAKECFNARWRQWGLDHPAAPPPSATWLDASEEQRGGFVAQEVAGLQSADEGLPTRCLESLVYLSLGVWEETAWAQPASEDGGQRPSGPDDVHDPPNRDPASLQRRCMRENVHRIREAGGLPALFALLQRACLRGWENQSANPNATSAESSLLDVEIRELDHALTLMYVTVEVTREQLQEGGDRRLKESVASLGPDYLLFLVKLLARLRWDDSTDLPLRKILLLFWKSILVLFGGSAELAESKAATHAAAGRTEDDETTRRITASPLDYHLFRQEITSKYPAYDPPAPLIPLESENNSILPPLSNHRKKSGYDDPPLGVGPANVNGNGGSILLQPVHIATPAPSPPPSPAGPGGKAGKKQNYQTNQNFPFLYPPLDSSSNHTGGKGGAGLQDVLVGKKWEGGDVPASILEAGDLFAGRVRMTRAVQQLWDERERFLQFERGWGGLTDDSPPDGADEPDCVTEEIGGVGGGGNDVARRLRDVETFYRDTLPYLQSLVIVLLKVILANVTSLITHPNGPLGPQGPPTAIPPQEFLDGSGHGRGLGREYSALNREELDALRSREITAKAVSGLLLLLLKWFKVSHVLKFEYLTQLLLDSNYLPLILKLFAHQDLDKVVVSQADRDEMKFFALCRQWSRPPSGEGVNDDGSDDDAACPPPVIPLRRSDRQGSSMEAGPGGERSATNATAPEVDELGYPTSELPAEPITVFSWRNFFSSINYLRIMQKMCKDKAHRNLLLVQYKSSTILKKALKVPQPQLRLYTLKLFKNQVPYCGRKWRSSNMRVITAVYLYCRPDLRDDWLAGSDVDAEVEEALPLEQALRALTHWHNLRRYPAQMGAETGMLDEEQDFFIRELEKMDFGDDSSPAEEMGGDRGWDGPVHLEGW
ncbi:MAG: Factor arrest protein 11 [Thelocarpon superellum]|nr:MAG: Factor arrest protein 11 [Thelocarpon superellum]